MVLEVLNCGKQRLGTSIILDGLCGGLSIIALVCIPSAAETFSPVQNVEN